MLPFPIRSLSYDVTNGNDGGTAVARAATPTRSMAPVHAAVVGTERGSAVETEGKVPYLSDFNFHSML